MRWRLEARGQIEGIGTSPQFSAKDGAGQPIADRQLDASVMRDGRAALGFVATGFANATAARASAASATASCMAARATRVRRS